MSKPHYLYSPSYRRASHVVESILGFLIIVAVILAIIVAAAGWYGLGGLIMAGALFTYLAVGIARAR